MVLEGLRGIQEDSMWDPKAEGVVRSTFPGLEAANLCYNLGLEQ